MLKILKWLVSILIFMAILVVAAVVITPLVVDPNDYKEDIASIIRDKTGRDLVIAEPIDLSVFPWLGVKLGGVEFSNAEGFGDRPFARIDQLDIKVQVSPLFAKRIEVDTVVLKGLQLNLARDARGVNNWDDLASSGKGKATEEPAKEGGAQVTADFDLGLQGLKIEQASVHWDDKQTGEHYEVNDLSLELGELTSEGPVPVNLEMKLVSTEPRLNLSLALGAEVSANKDFQRVQALGLALNLVAEGEGLPSGGLELKAAADLAIDRSSQEMVVEDFSLSGPSVDITGNIAASQIETNPALEGKLNLQETNIKELLTLFGVVIETADKDAMTRVSGEFDLRQAGSGILLKPLTIKVDDSALTGYVEVSSWDGPTVRTELTLDAIDLDRYLPPPADASLADASVDKGAASAEGAVEENPLAALHSLDLNASFAIGKLTVNKLHLQDVSLVARSKKGVLRIDPMQAQLYQGTFKGQVGLDSRQKKPRSSFKADLTGIKVGPLLKDLTGDDTLLGTGEVHTNLRMAGLDERSIRNSLNGDLSLSFKEGAYKGINVAHTIRQAYALIGGPKPEANAPQQTDFSELTASAKVKDGVIQNNDLLAKSPLLRIEGKGKVDLPDDKVNYLLTTTIVESLEGQGGKSKDDLLGVPIPVRLKGDLQNPQPSVDLEAALSGKVKQEIENQAREKLDDALGDKLKGLFR